MSLSLTVKEGMCLGEFEEKYKLLSHWINNEAVFRITLSSEWYVNNIEFKYMYQIGQTICLYLNYTQQIYENGNTFTCYVYINRMWSLKKMQYSLYKYLTYQFWFSKYDHMLIPFSIHAHLASMIFSLIWLIKLI